MNKIIIPNCKIYKKLTMSPAIYSYDVLYNTLRNIRRFSEFKDYCILFYCDDIFVKGISRPLIIAAEKINLRYHLRIKINYRRLL